MEQINSILIISFLLIVFSCNPNYSHQDEYNVINAVVEERVYPIINMDIVSDIMKRENIGYNDAVKRTQNIMSKNIYEFSASDTLYALDTNTPYFKDLYSKIIFQEDPIKKNNIKIDFDKIHFRHNVKKVTALSNHSSYIGDFKFYRGIFNEEGTKALFGVKEYPGQLYSRQNNLFLLEKKNEKWNIISMFSLPKNIK